MFIKLTEVETLSINDDAKPCGFRHSKMFTQTFCNISKAQLLKFNITGDATRIYFAPLDFIEVKETPEQIIKMIEESK